MTRILMKIFLMKVIKDLKSKNKINETNLITLIEFYKIIKDDLSEIEDIAEHSNNASWFVNPKFFMIDSANEHSFLEHVTKELN